MKRRTQDYLRRVNFTYLFLGVMLMVFGFGVAIMDIIFGPSMVLSTEDGWFYLFSVWFLRFGFAWVGVGGLLAVLRVLLNAKEVKDA